MLGDFTAEKVHFLKVMGQRFALLKEGRTLSQTLTLKKSRLLLLESALSFSIVPL
jgi:hypothetical protein